MTESFPALEHDHAHCVDDAIERAHKAMADRGLRMTPLRLRVLNEIAGSHCAVGAYDLLDKLAKTGRRLAPISVYRAIDALLDAGVVHRLESRNAFFACHAGHDQRRRLLFLACDQCGRVAEVEGEEVFSEIEDLASNASFSLKRSIVEASGLCASCVRGGPRVQASS